MIRGSLYFFSRRVLKTRYISEGDVRTLERVIFSDGVTSRKEVEVLLHLARRVPAADPAWADFLVKAVVDFVVWGARPTGYVDPDTARWLIGIFGKRGPSKLTRRVAREIMREAEHVDVRLAEFAQGRIRFVLRTCLAWLTAPRRAQAKFNQPNWAGAAA
jgi:hypothetical protein